MKNEILNLVESWAIAFSPDGKVLASTGQSGNINIWDFQSGKKLQVLETSSKFTMPVAFVSFFFFYLII